MGELSPEEVKVRLIELKEKLGILSQEIDKAVEEERYDDAETLQTELEETENEILNLESSNQLQTENPVEAEVGKESKEIVFEDEGVVNDTVTAPCSTITSEAPNHSHGDFKSNQSQIDSKSDEVEGQPNVGAKNPQTESISSDAQTQEAKSPTTATTEPSADMIKEILRKQ